MNDESKLIEEFNAFADCYDEVVTEHLGYTSHETIPTLMLNYIVNDTPEILDLGCGTGISSTIFLNRKFNVTGIDVSPGMIQQAEKRPFKKLFCQNLEEPLYFKDGEFDAVTLLGVMEFIAKPGLLFKRVAHVLKTGGILGVTFPMNKPDVETGLEVNSYDFEQIDALVAEAGFELLECKSLLGYDSEEYTINYAGYILRKV